MSLDSAFSAGGALKFANVGDAHTFTVSDVTEEERTNLKGDPETVIVVHGTDDEGESVRLFCQKGQLKYAIGQAVAEATGTAGAPKPGGKLYVVRGEDGTPSQAGYSAPHSYTAKYKAPEPGAAPVAADPFAAAAAPSQDPF